MEQKHCFYDAAKRVEDLEARVSYTKLDKSYSLLLLKDIMVRKEPENSTLRETRSPETLYSSKCTTWVSVGKERYNKRSITVHFEESIELLVWMGGIYGHPIL